MIDIVMNVSSHPERFELLETMRWSPTSGFFLLERHLLRMQQSARYFDYVWNESGVRDALARAVVQKDQPQRLRLLTSREGAVRVECAPLSENTATPARLGIAHEPVDPRTVFLYHKTTNRSVYNAAAQPDCDDVVLWTSNGDVTETTLGNIVVEINGCRITPPVDAGLLAGTFRAELLDRGEIVERRVTLEDLKSASRVWIINSVREWWPADIQWTAKDSSYIATAAATAPSNTSSATPTNAKRIQR